MEHTIQVQKEDMLFNVLSIGEVKSGDIASATITGKEPNQVLNLTLPKGEKGDIGLTGPKGDPGEKGANGTNGIDGYTPIKGTDYWTTSDKQEIVNDVLNEVDIPNKTSDITNDSGFITSAVSDLVNYYLKNDTYSKNEVNTLINNITKVTISIVDVLPTNGESNIIYFVPKTGSTNDVYDEYVWITNDWEHIGSTDVDLTGYATENWVNTQIENFLTEAQVNTLITNALTNYALKSEIPTKNSQLQNDNGYITSNDIPSIPTKVSELQNDSDFITGYTETDPTVPAHIKSITEEDITNWNISKINSLITGFKMYENNAGIYKSKYGAYVYYREGKSFHVQAGSVLILSGDSSSKTRMFILIESVESGASHIFLGQSSKNSGYFVSLNNSNLLDGQGNLLTTSNGLSKTNTTEYTPTSSYHPATKKYVDDNKFSGSYNDLSDKPTIPTFTLDGTTLNINTEA